MTEDVKYSIEDVANIVDNEGLEYAILHYLNDDNIDDSTPRGRVLARLWRDAKAHLQAIDNLIQLEGYEDED